MHTASTPRVALVTGANRGLGRALAHGLARHGLHVITTARSNDAAQRAAAELRDLGGLASGHQLDVTNPASVFRAFADTIHEHGRLDVLINSAAVAIDRNKTVSAPDMEIVQETMNANVMGVWRCCAQAVPAMRDGGYGRILNITSHMGSLSTMESSSPSYRISKAALNAFTLTLAHELAGENILVNAASPGLADTRLAYGHATQSAEAAAEAMLWLALLPDSGPTGGIFHGPDRMAW
ncbi:SDR family NAD(P)-dependent oxidoreductase [Streptomyces niveus]|uniref:SDR family NAD(P)-dependent oxidoreductase n=1 Tax=Streptomyces niveus TaxID=193462 RepID=UPI0035E25DEE